jgi:hypothetical protein
MTRRGNALGVALIVSAIIGAGWISRQELVDSDQKKAGIPAPRHRAHPSVRPAEQALATASARRQILADWEELLLWLRAAPSPSAEEIRIRLLATRVAWTEMDPQELAAAIKHLLEAGDDAATHIDFEVGVHGLLAGWPTMRVFLLDVLATSDPVMASAIAKHLLDKTTSPDEFATGLRSLTRQGMSRASDSELLSRFDQMLGHPQWQGSRGFAEAFDLARVLGSPDAARRLASWNGYPALRNMAMHEFAAEHPAEMLDALGPEATISGLDRASLMARVNPEDPQQLAAADRYLRNTDLASNEASEFLKTFPLRSATTGHRLYGKSPSPYTYEQIKAGDRAAMTQVNAWIADPSLGGYQQDLLALQRRLATWNQQSE